jgi:hypothetical protein
LTLTWEFSTEILAPCITPIVWGRLSIPPPPLISVLDYNSLFMFFNFPGGWGSVCSRVVLDSSRGWGFEGCIGEPRVLC